MQRAATHPSVRSAHVSPAGGHAVAASPPATPPPGPAPAPAPPTPADQLPAAPRQAVQLPSADLRHLLSRFTYGVTEDLVAEARGLGGMGGTGGMGGAAATDDGGRAWFERQLQPQGIPDGLPGGFDEWWPRLSWSPAQQWAEDQQGGQQGHELEADFVRWTLMRRIYSDRQVLEIMTEFWANLLHVPVPLKRGWPQRTAYDATIRQHALGRYDDLVVAAVLHPAMLCYLDNAESSKKSPNENLGREVLELHTVGRDAAITQNDVVGSTRILTGWTVDMGDTWRGYYNKADHYVGPVRVFEFSSPNDSPDGQALTVRYLRWLARRPETAQRVAERLATRFISDEPSGSVINHLATVFRQSGTDIKETLRALIAHPEFRASRGAKVRTPNDDLANTYRVMQIKLDKPVRETDGAATIFYVAGLMGQRPFGWPSPNGFPDASEAWSSASRVLGSWQVHRQVALGFFPRSGVAFKPVTYWLPDLPCRFDEIVDHLARRLLAIEATKTLVEAACRATDLAPDDIVQRGSGLARHGFDQVLQALLDTPEHMSR